MPEENITCATCRAVYTATVTYATAPGEQYCQVCSDVLIRWDGKRFYSDFRLIYNPRGIHRAKR